MKILVTDCDCTASLAVIHSLYKQGFEITAASHKKYAMGFFSKCVKNRKIYPSPLDKPLEFIDEMLNTCKEYDMIFPTTDATILLFQKYRDRFHQNLKLGIPNKKGYENVTDKEKVLKTAMAQGIPVPKTLFIKAIEDLDTIENKITYPAVIKPKFSKYFDGKENKIKTGEVVYAYSKAELLKTYKNISTNVPFPMIQEFIPGRGYGIELLIEKGEAIASFQHKRIREMKPTGGGSSFCESVEIDKNMFENSLRLLKTLDFEGPAMVEYRLDNRDNTYKLMEINGRFWGSLPLAIECGVDFPLLFYKSMEGQHTKADNYKIGVKGRWLSADTIHLWSVLKGKPKGWNSSFPARIPTLWNYFKLIQGNTTYFNIKRYDPYPGIIEFLELFIK